MEKRRGTAFQRSRMGMMMSISARRRRAQGRKGLRALTPVLTLAALLPVATVLFSCSDGTSPPPPSSGEDDPSPPTFLTVEEMVEEMARIAERHPSIALLVDLTTTYGTPPTAQGRRLHALKISDQVDQEEDEPAFLMVAAHHGNEYGTPVVALDAIGRFTEGYGVDTVISGLVDEYEIWIAPVWNADGYPETRKNRSLGDGVDLNRNYPFLWDSECGGSSSPTSGTYRGPSPSSEPETQTMMAFSQDQRFTKVLDLHSAGREVVYGYRCSTYPLSTYLQEEAIAYSEASSYGGAARPPSGEGEHYQWQLGTFSNYALLMEISDTQSPSYASALQEAARLWPGTIWMLKRPIPIWGHVTDAVTGEPLEANIHYPEHPFLEGEQNRSEPRFGRYHAFLPEGEQTLRFTHPEYEPKEIRVTVTGEATPREVTLAPRAGENVEG